MSNPNQMYKFSDWLCLALVAIGLLTWLPQLLGVPAALLFLPAVFCISWAFFLAEVFRFRFDRQRHN